MEHDFGPPAGPFRGPAGSGTVVVVGGGLAGLAAAAYLARGGAAVVLFERAEGTGGRAASETREGFRFNRGDHALYTGGAASAVLAELGVTYSAGSPPGAVISVLRGGRLRPAPTGPLSLLRSDLLSLGDKVELLRFLVTLPRVEPGTLAGVSVRDWLEGCTRGPAVRRLLAAQARTLVYSTALDLVSAEVLADRLRQALTHPVHYVDGGWQTLADGLRRAAEAAGARIVAGAPVEAVLLGAGRAGGVRLRDGTVVAAGAVVVATSPREAARLVDGDPGERRAGSARPVLRRAVADLLPARLACLDVALCRLPTAVAPVVQDLDRPLFLTTQSGYSRVAPEGGALVYTMKPLDPRREDAGAPGEDERELEGLLDAALPGWRALVVARVFLPRIAAAGALPTAAGGGFAGRPGVAIPDLAGVYLAGDWVGPEGFLADASLASARAAARLALGQQAVDSAAA